MGQDYPLNGEFFNGSWRFWEYFSDLFTVFLWPMKHILCLVLWHFQLGWNNGLKCNFKWQTIETNSIINFYQQESMKLFLWTKKWLFLITQFFFAYLVCVVINFIDLSLNRFGKILMLRINKCVQHFSGPLTSTFVLVWVGHILWVFNCAFIGISWAIRPFISHEIHARL